MQPPIVRLAGVEGWSERDQPCGSAASYSRCAAPCLRERRPVRCIYARKMAREPPARWSDAWRCPDVSDGRVPYGMIVLDAEPIILRSRGLPIVFRTMHEAVEFAFLRGVQRWMVSGDPGGWGRSALRQVQSAARARKEHVDVSMPASRRVGRPELAGASEFALARDIAGCAPANTSGTRSGWSVTPPRVPCGCGGLPADTGWRVPSSA